MPNPWDRWVVPFAVRRLCGGRPIQRQRAKVVPQAAGRVLEIGVGSGLNLPLYEAERVEQLVGVDPSRELMRDAARAAASMPFEVELVHASAEALPAPDASFDTVVVTYTLCSIPDLGAALSEVRRVLRPGGALLFSEHGRAPDADVARWQRRLTPAWRRLGGGCHLDRAMPELIAAAGFAMAELDAMYLPGPRFLNYHYWGRAVRPAEGG